MLYFSVILLAIGVTMLVKPRLVYELAEGWKHDGSVGEPSKLYLFSTKFGGVMFILAGICGLLVPFLA